MNHVVSVIGLGSLHQAHSTVLPGRRVSSLMLSRMVGVAKDKPSVHNISRPCGLKIMHDERVSDCLNHDHCAKNRVK